MADNQPVPMPPHIKAELARLRALMIPDAEAYRRREIGSKRMEEEAKKIQPLRPLSAADTDLEYLPAAKGGSTHMEKSGVFKAHVMPFVNRGLDSMFPLRQMMQKAYIKDLWDPVNSAMAQDIPAAVRNMNVNRQDANSAKYHMENAARKSVGMEPLPERYYDPAKALGQINVNEFPNPDNPIKPKSARLWDDIFLNGDYKKSKGGVIDMDRMRLELMGKAKPKRMHMAEGGGIDEYQGGHKPPSESYGAPLHDLTQIYPDDIYSHKALNLYGMGHPEHKKMDMESLFKAQLYRNKPDSSVPIFRAVPQHIDKINPQDWVTLSPMYAKLHGESRLGGKYKILKKTVKAKDLWTAGDSIHEWGYHPEEEKKAKGGSVMGVNVASDRKHNLNYADLIVDGHKTIESRNSDTLRPYVGKRVAIVRTRAGKAKAIGEVTIGEPIVANKKQFRNMESHHLVPKGSTFDIKTPTKHMYPLSEPVRYDEERDVGHGIISRKVIHKDKGGKIEVRPTVFDDAASRRNPKIEAAARALMEGEMKQKAYAKLVAKEKPVKPYEFIPKPATDEDAMRALHEPKKPKWRGHESWPAGHRVGLRLDIPAYEDHGVWVNSIHDESGAKGDDMLKTAYGPVSAVRNAEFQGTPHKAIQVATGEKNKAPFAKIMGELEHMTEEQAVKHMKKYLKHPDYRQIGYDPRRHGDFYDRETMEPVTHSEHVVQIGPLVLAKKPKYGKREVYAKGGATHAHHLDIEERPL